MPIRKVNGSGVHPEEPWRLGRGITRWAHQLAARRDRPTLTTIAYTAGMVLGLRFCDSRELYFGRALFTPALRDGAAQGRGCRLGRADPRARSWRAPDSDRDWVGRCRCRT